MASTSDGSVAADLGGMLASGVRLKTVDEFTNEFVIHLRKLQGNASMCLATDLKQLAPLEMMKDIEKCKEDSLRKRMDSVYLNYKKLSASKNKEKLAIYCKTQFELPKSRESPTAAAAESTSTQYKLKQTRKELKDSKKRCAQSEHEVYELEQSKEVLTQEYFSVVSQLHENADSFRKIIEEKSDKVSDLSKALSAANKTNDELTAKLDSLEARLSRVGTVKNVNKKVKRRDETIQKKNELIEQLQGAVSAGNQELNELREAQEHQTSATEKVRALQTKVKSLQDSKRKLQVKLQKIEEDKVQVQTDLDATVDTLNGKIQDLENENKHLEAVQSLMDSDTVTTFYEGRYSNDLREVIMNLLTSGVSLKKVDHVITTVLSKLAGKKIDRFPSVGLKHRLVIEAKILGDRQVAEAIIAGAGNAEQGNCLHQDGTSKFFKKYQTFDVTTTTGDTLTMSMTEVPSGDAAGILTAFSESCRSLAEVLCEPGEDVAKKTAEIITSFTCTMSDRGATNPLFNKHLESLRRELLPVVKDEWDTLSDEVKDELGDMCNYFCKMHLLVNFATEANVTVKIFEDAVSEGKNPFAFAQQGESGAARLIRTACSAFTDRGNEKSGAPQFFQSYLSQHGEQKNYMVTYRGNRFNILFYNAAAVYHHLKQMVTFVSSWPDANNLLKAVKADASQKVYVAGVRALGIIDKTITGPFFRVLGTEKNILGMNTHLHQMQIGLERWSRDASTLLAGEPLFNETEVERHKDALFDSLFAATEDEDLDVLTQQALEVVCSALLILLERQAEEQLPGGKFWKPTETEVTKSQHVPTTNVASERDFAILDNLLRAKPYGTSLSFEAHLLWINNQTSAWLRNLTPEERNKHMDYARTNASRVQQRFKERQSEIKEKRLQTLLERQRQKEEKRRKARLKTVALTDKVMNMGGVWKTPEEVEDKVKTLNKEQEKLEAIKFQLQFHKQVLKSEGSKELFQMTITKPGKKKHTFSSEEKILHLKEVVMKNVSGVTDIDLDSEDEDDQEYVTLKEPEARTVPEMRVKLVEKRDIAREKREIDRQKQSLPVYIKDPSKLVGCRVKHQCDSTDEQGNKEARWFEGAVTEIVNRTEEAKDTVYKIVYDDENESDEEFNLLSDLAKGWLIIL